MESACACWNEPVAKTFNEARILLHGSTAPAPPAPPGPFGNRRAPIFWQSFSIDVYNRIEHLRQSSLTE